METKNIGYIFYTTLTVFISNSDLCCDIECRDIKYSDVITLENGPLERSMDR